MLNCAGGDKGARVAKGARVPEVELPEVRDDYDEEVSDCSRTSADEKYRRAVAGVRSRKMKATARKKLQCMARATRSVVSLCFMTVLGFAQEVVGEPINDLWTCCSGAWVVPDGDEERPDLLEIFAGKGRISRTFEAAGLTVLPPWDLLHGQDLRQASRRVLQLIREERPKLVWLAPPCTNFCELRRLRLRDRVFLELEAEWRARCDRESAEECRVARATCEWKTRADTRSTWTSAVLA